MAAGVGKVISVLMPAYNAEQYIAQSVRSVLSQTFEDFELIIVNDASTDGTRDIILSFNDPRLKLLDNDSNKGIVSSLNSAMQQASGRYVARMDADDYSLPTRFAKQHAFLEAHPDVKLVGAEMSVLQHGQVQFRRQRASQDPALLRWMLHISNPIGHPSMMFRADVVDTLGEYLREPFKYAEDFDFSHRVARLGQIAVMPEYLVIYRQHRGNATVLKKSEMVSKTTHVLEEVYSRLGLDAVNGARLVAQHMIAFDTLHKGEDLSNLGSFLTQLVARFTDEYQVTAQQKAFILAHTSRLWWQVLEKSLRDRQYGNVLEHKDAFDWVPGSRPSFFGMFRSAVAGLVQPRARRNVDAMDRATPSAPDMMLNGVSYIAAEVRPEDPPTLYVVVDTEAEFDWAKQFSRDATDVTAVQHQRDVHDIFDGYGLRPVYLVDHAVASQIEGVEPLREILARHTCIIGAHLHPWINPPLEETISEENSFAGNLPLDLEERKLKVLVNTITDSFGVRPLFFKAGRYGTGPNTTAILRRNGFFVDFSILPMSDLRHRGGPDFRSAACSPYQVSGSHIVSYPMTRGQIGLLAPIPQYLHNLLYSKVATNFRLPGVFSRLGLINTVTLTPEGVTANEQIRLIKRLVREGHKTFVLHYHSSTLGMHTPYATTASELVAFKERLSQVCGFFFDDIGGYPGYPPDLLPPNMRNEVWPQPDIAVAGGRL